ncbi:aminotransferase class I/II-fold pyridoxal phosphate-dependent enzyme [Humibacter sp. RRB41]|uniref:aminotransferase class I/II-fold pyridoxal phosphate-dependent enzyme n=1 Tax=Humibacter sp. RRB41 TaxID=2919946 RepID=UPI001FA947BE|nr:aminotransferase class I/II-fold pyridoxal phosphate-dependent enzyme [Humibacter sp. RRB41]
MSVIEAHSAAVSPQWLLQRVKGTTSAELGAGLEQLIRSGTLAPGAQLPTIRDLAQAASTSVGTILAVWNHLREAGLIETHRRGGTTVRTATALHVVSDWSSIDFQQGEPDISLQPELGSALLDSLTAPNLNVFGREYMTERLYSAVAPSWPFRADAWMTAGGGTEALLLATAAAAQPGSAVAVDEPVSPGFLDTLRDLDLRPMAVAADESGPLPASLADAIEAGATAFIFQPGAPFAVDHAVTMQRARELAATLSRAENAHVVVVEDDSIGPLARRAVPTLGQELTGRVLRVRSYCKAYGIDVRTSVIGGPRRLVDRAIGLRSHGVGSNSRILQNALAYLVQDDDANARVADARERYERRRELLVDALRRQDLTVHVGADGIVLWVEVADETDALVGLAAKGILAGAAAKSFIVRPEHPMIRLSAMQLPEDDTALFERLAETITMAAQGGRREFFD